MEWTFDQLNSRPGLFQVLARKPGRGVVDISQVRGVPTIVDNYNNGDPFGDGTCVLQFPGITGWDDLNSADIGTWLGDYAEIDVNWLSAYPVNDLSFANTIDPATQQLTHSTRSDSASMVQVYFPPDADPYWALAQGVRQDVTDPSVNVKHNKPVSWADGQAEWVWPAPFGPTQSDLPSVRALFRQTFTSVSGAHTLHLTADNEVQFWVDGVVQLAVTTQPQDWGIFHTIPITLSAGTHEITAVVINSGVNEWRSGETFDQLHNPAGLLFNITKNSDQSVVARSSHTSTYAQRIYPQRTKLYEGYIASMETSTSEKNSGFSVQCQGALYQADRYLQKPSYPPRPIPNEMLLATVFDHTSRPHLRTQPLAIDWPAGWNLVVPAYTGVNAYTLDARPGTKYTGYSSRATGAWDHSLTGFAADLLATMFVDEKAGVSLGNQWTIIQGSNRRPILKVRDRHRTADFELWYGQAGMTCSMTRDNTQTATIIYGEGTATDGSTWRNAVISADGSKTDYKPLAALQTQYPEQDNPAFDKNSFVSETLYKYGSGFGQDQAEQSAKKSLQRDAVPGWNGEIVLYVDPYMSRWTIRAGMTLLLKGFMGTGDEGMRFHIAQVQCNPQQGTVTMTVDTRYRDLLNLEEARARTRDPLTPSKMLQVNRRTVMIEDSLAPWDYTAGSGFIPLKSSKFHAVRDNSEIFPWKKFLKSHSPRQYPQWYVKVNADKARRADRWTLGAQVPILMSQKGSIRRTEVVCCDVDGNIIPVEFHFSIYYTAVTTTAMPRGSDGLGPSPFITNAFESVDPSGAVFPVGNYFAPDPSIVIGWGNKDQPAGYSPGRKSDGGAKTGILVDESTWTFDCTNNPNFHKDAKPGQTQPASTFTCYGAFYAEHTQPVYFMGRLFRAEPGA